MLWHRESARHHWRECSDLHLQWQTKWAWTPVSSDVHSNKGLSKGWPLKVLYFGTYPVPASFGTCHQPATQECQVLTIKQMDKCLHLFIFSVIMFILPALWFFTLSRSSPLFLIMFPDNLDDVWYWFFISMTRMFLVRRINEHITHDDNFLSIPLDIIKCFVDGVK